MARGLSIILALLLFPVTASAQQLDKEKLRHITLPAPSFLLPGVLRAQHEHRGVPLDWGKAIASLQKDVNRTPDDAFLLVKLGQLQCEVGQGQEAVKPHAAAKRCFESLLATESDNAFCQANYATTLLMTDETERADRLILTIAKADSKDWRAWHFLGEHAFFRCATSLGLDVGATGEEAALRRVEDHAQVDSKTSLNVNIAECWLDFTEVCMNKAAHLAPREPDVWLGQLLVAMRGARLRNVIRVARGQPADPKLVEAAAARGWDCLRHVCRLAPDCPYYYGACAAMAKTAGPDYQKEIEFCLAQLDKLAGSNDPGIAGPSHINAAFCCVLLKRSAPALAHARKALDLSPGDEIAWNMM